MKRLVTFLLIFTVWTSSAQAGPLPPELYHVNNNVHSVVYGQRVRKRKVIKTRLSPIDRKQPRGMMMAESIELPPDPGISLDDIQADFYSNYGRYWQGLRTHIVVPEAGSPSPPMTTTHPTDQPESWADVGVPLSDTMDMALTVSVYDGPSGKGYVVVAETVISETLWLRTINFGPETWRQHYWISMSITATAILTE